jgi:hypothetical protein
MKLFHSKSPFENQDGKHGSVLIIVLWIAIGLISIALYFANSMTFELRASDNRASGLATGQAIEGAARYVSYVLANYATNGAMPSNTMFSCEAVPVGDAHFWIIGRDPDGTSSSDPCFGLIDEGSKLNLNCGSFTGRPLIYSSATTSTAMAFMTATKKAPAVTALLHPACWNMSRFTHASQISMLMAVLSPT